MHLIFPLYTMFSQFRSSTPDTYVPLLLPIPQQTKYTSHLVMNNVEYCLLSNNINDYHVVSQGKTTIPNVDDGEEFNLTDVRHRLVFSTSHVFEFIVV